MHERPWISIVVTSATATTEVVSWGASREMLLTLLLSCGYCLYGFDQTTGQPAPAEGRAFSSNMLALPSETPLPDWRWI